MSLIVARKENNKISIVSDTKLTYPNHEIKRQQTNPLEGIIKTVILNSDLCISFAGEIEYAETALKEIHDNFKLAQIINILEKSHTISNTKTEFLICTGLPSFSVIQIKNGKTEYNDFCWIGDKNAFNKFQEYMLTTEKKQPEVLNKVIEIETPTILNTLKQEVTITDMNLNFEVSHDSDLFSKMSYAMDSVIEANNIESVGGFNVNVIYENKFFYNSYMKYYRQNMIMVGAGSHVIGHGDAKEGAYSISFFGGSEDYKNVCLHLKQGNFGVIYNRKDNGLLRPLVVNLDEVDFSDFIKKEYNFITKFSTQDRVNKFLTEAIDSFNKKDFLKSEKLFDKALDEAKTNEKAHVLFNKGITLLRLRDKQPAMKAFHETVKIDATYTQKIFAILNRK